MRRPLDGTAEAVLRICRDDGNMARHVKWRRNGYRVELQDRIEERHGERVDRRELTEAANRLSDDGVLVELGVFDLDEIKVVV